MRACRLGFAVVVSCFYLFASGCSGADNPERSADAGAGADAGPALDAYPEDNLSRDGANFTATPARAEAATVAPIPQPSRENCITAGHDERVCARTCVLDGTVQIEDRADLQRIAKLGCDVIDGSLGVRKTQLTDLDGLDSIRIVTGWLHIEDNDRLVDIDGLRNIERFEGLNVWDNKQLPSLDAFESLAARPAFIGTDIRIRNNAALASIDGLATVESALFLWIEDNPSLADLSGLRSLRRAGWIKLVNADEIVDLHGLESLEHVGNRCDSINGGGFSINDNDKLRSLDGLDNLQRVTHSIGINGNPSLVDVSALEGFGGAQPCYSGAGLVIGNNDALESLAAITGLSSLAIVGNDALTNIDALRSVTEADYLQISDNDSLADIDALQNLRSARYLGILNNDALQNIDGLQSLESVSYYRTYLGEQIYGGLTITGNPKLTNLDGLSALGSGDDNDIDVQIQDNATLTDVSGLSGLTRANELVIKSNGALRDLDGLEGLRQLDDGLTIEQNAVLSNADALLGLTALGYLRVVDNPKLPACYASAIASGVAPDGEVEIQGNDDGVCP